MTSNASGNAQHLPAGVMLNAYPDSIGSRLSDIVALLRRPELEGAFSLFYILPTFFHSDLDRGFSIIDYGINEELVSPEDLAALRELGITIKLDLVLNHLSVRSPQFQDLLLYGETSRYRDFFIDWNRFWEGHGSLQDDGIVMPDREFLDKLFMRKPGLPVLRIRFPDNSLKVYWNTFYQKVSFDEITVQDFAHIEGIVPDAAERLADRIKIVIMEQDCLEPRYLEDIASEADISHLADEIIAAVCHKRDYLGQMDLNARSELVWDFYAETLARLAGYGARVIRLDAFAYLHKAPGQPNFFNRPGTWEYLQRVREIAGRHDLVVFPEIHTEYGAGVHTEIGQQGFPLYDFYLPGLLLDALEYGDNRALLQWIDDIQTQGLQVITMLGSHDGIPVLDLRGKHVNGSYRPGLLDDARIEASVQRILQRGGMIKNLYGPDGRKIDYYQVNATFFSALGEDEHKLLLARAIHMFMPGVPQVWYLDLFAGRNDYAAAARGDRQDSSKHKEINRTTLTLQDVEIGLQRAVVRDQIELIRLRNTFPAFRGGMTVDDCAARQLHIRWRNGDTGARLLADLAQHTFTVYTDDGSGEAVFMSCEGVPEQVRLRD